MGSTRDADLILIPCSLCSGIALNLAKKGQSGEISQHRAEGDRDGQPMEGMSPRHAGGYRQESPLQGLGRVTTSHSASFRLFSPPCVTAEEHVGELKDLSLSQHHLSSSENPQGTTI
jgi:hypothetical protein